MNAINAGRYITSYDQVSEWPRIDQGLISGFYYTRCQGMVWKLVQVGTQVALYIIDDDDDDPAAGLAPPALLLRDDNPEQLVQAVLADFPAYVMRALL